MSKNNNMAEELFQLVGGEGMSLNVFMCLGGTSPEELDEDEFQNPHRVLELVESAQVEELEDGYYVLSFSDTSILVFQWENTTQSGGDIAFGFNREELLDQIGYISPDEV